MVFVKAFMVDLQSMLMPDRASWKQRILGYQNLIRSIQQPTILGMLNLQVDDLVLDCGCGDGYYLNSIVECKANPVAADWKLSKGILFSRNKQPKVPFLKADAQKLPFADSQFDTVLLSSVLQMVENDEELLRECHRVLRNSGVLVLSVTVDYRFFYRLNTVKPQLKIMFGVEGKGYYTLDEVKRLLEKDFRLSAVEYSPRLLGSLLYEAELYMWYRFRIPFLSAAIYPIFGVIAFFDRHLGGQVGDELIIRAQKR
jgi:ubiquinone/menaquinone biosynthesis C-methylase UbiE